MEDRGWHAIVMSEGVATTVRSRVEFRLTLQSAQALSSCLARSDRNSVGQKNGIRNEKCLRLVLKSCVAKIDSSYTALEADNHHEISPPKRVVEENHYSGQNVRQCVAERKAERKTGQAETGNQGRNVYSQGACCGYETKDEERHLRDATNERQDSFFLRISLPPDSTYDLFDNDARTHEGRED